MANRTLRFLTFYFRVLAITCSAQKRATQGLLSAYLAMVLGDMMLQMWHYLNRGWQLNDFHLRRQQHYTGFVRILDAMNVAYLITHMVMVLQALLFRNRERLLLSQLPDMSSKRISLTTLRIHLIVDCSVTTSALFMGLFNSLQVSQMIANIRYLFSTQAVRGRCLQVAMLVMRLDAQQLQLQDELTEGRRCSLELRATYAHIVRLSRQISGIYGLSVLMLNVLCIGDFIMVCYAYIVLWEISDSNLTWLLVWQGLYVLLPTMMKIWILCAASERCAKHSAQLQQLLNAAYQQTRMRTGLNMRSTRTQTNEFAVQIMQNPVQFDICGIYYLNLQSLAGMFLFIVESLVIFLQFIALDRQ
ncbi:putative gustatory receptor 9a [Drosophila albomicans]|uniref:Gustatory receptor n=1 Tax=Drosophila albomicans TaxID=7291 RepID=A0A6P8XLN1_DROAB|nr:putative gustatory receptor 9a [Drosophila albomicans]